MSINDPLGDMLARIRNAQMRHKTKVTTPASKLREHVLDVLVEEGYHPRLCARRLHRRPVGVRHRAQIFRRRAGDQGHQADVDAGPARVLLGASDLPTVANGLGVAILSTPKGVMSDSRARD